MILDLAPTDPVNTNEEELWHIAKNYTAVLGPPPPWIVSSVRAIRNASTLFGEARSDETREVVAKILKRPMNSPALSSIFLSAAEEYYGTHFVDYTSIDSFKALRFFSGEEVNALLTIVYIARRLRRASQHELMGTLLARARTHIAIGRIVGELIPNVSYGDGMLASGLRYLAFGCFLAANPKLYEKNKCGLRAGKKIFDNEREEAAFGTTHGFVAACLAQEYGFGVQIANTFISPPRVIPKQERVLTSMVTLGEMTERVQVAGNLMNAGIVAKEQFTTDVRLRDLAAKLDTVLANPECTAWMLGASKQATAAETEEVPES